MTNSTDNKSLSNPPAGVLIERLRERIKQNQKRLHDNRDVFLKQFSDRHLLHRQVARSSIEIEVLSAFANRAKAPKTDG